MHLEFVLQCTSNLYCSAFDAPYALRNQYPSHLYRSTPPICIAIRLPFALKYFGGKILVVVGHRNVQARKRNPNPNFLSGYLRVGWGSYM